MLAMRKVTLSFLYLFCKELSEPVPPTNSDTSRDKCEGLSTTGGGDAEVFEDLASAYVLRPCDTCVLFISEDLRTE